MVVYDAVLPELHLATHARIPSLPLPHSVPEPALEIPAP